MVLKEIWDQAEILDLLVNKDNKVTKDCQAYLDLQDLLVRLDQLDLLALAFKVHKGPLDPKVMLDHWDQQDQMVHRDLKDLKAKMDH